MLVWLVPFFKVRPAVFWVVFPKKSEASWSFSLKGKKSYSNSFPKETPGCKFKRS